MMEFTFQGIVRQGFGFYNPNHAAALICALFPFLWEAWSKRKHPAVRGLIIGGNLLLLTALMLTFSRTGVLVLIMEMVLYWGLQKNRNLKFVFFFIVIILILFLSSGILSRFVLDRAIMNRPLIWLAGAGLFAENPSGVGCGNSGLLATTFLLPEGVVCRTLINSHLTLLAEYGIATGFLWFGFLFYAFLSGWKFPVLLSSFAGLTVSGACSTVFDFGLLFDFREFGMLSFSNFLLSWITLLVYAGIFMGICIKSKFRWRNLLISAGGSLFLLFTVYFTGTTVKNVPKVRGEFIVKSGKEMPLALYDGNWDLKSVLSFFPDGYYIPLRSWEFRADIPACGETLFLFGRSGGNKNIGARTPIVLVSPPDSIIFPRGTIKILIRRYGEEMQAEQAQEKKIPYDYY